MGYELMIRLRLGMGFGEIIICEEIAILRAYQGESLRKVLIPISVVNDQQFLGHRESRLWRSVVQVYEVVKLRLIQVQCSRTLRTLTTSQFSQVASKPTSSHLISFTPSSSSHHLSLPYYILLSLHRLVSLLPNISSLKSPTHSIRTTTTVPAYTFLEKQIYPNFSTAALNRTVSCAVET